MNIFRFLFITALLSCIYIMGCDKPRITVEKGPLYFSEDTLKFDTVFTTLTAPTERLIVRNKSNNNIKVARIWLASGENSEFDMIVDGVRTKDAKDVIIAAKDSMHIFVTMTSQQKDKFVEEYINVQVGNEVQKVLLRALVWDAYFFQIKHIKKPDGSDSLINPYVCVFSLDTTFTNEKPIVIDGPLIVPRGRTLNIDAGTKLYFTSRKIYQKDEVNNTDGFYLYSMIYVAGTLKINGTHNQKVMMEGARIHTDSIPLFNYSEASGQWRGLYFAQESQNSVIEHAEIKNGQIGLMVDSASNNSNPKLTVRYTKMRNMSAYGVVNLGRNGGMGAAPAIRMENSLVNECNLYNVVQDKGGWSEYYNCTFANTISSKQPTVSVNNYEADQYGTIIEGPFNVKTRFVNCAVWGGDNHELQLAIAEGSQNDVQVRYCAVKIDTEKYGDYISKYFYQTLVNENPQFKDGNARDYHLTKDSPLIDKGTNDISEGIDYQYDISGDTLRTTPFDIGAYEFR